MSADLNTNTSRFGNISGIESTERATKYLTDFIGPLKSGRSINEENFMSVSNRTSVDSSLFSICEWMSE